MYGGSDGSSNQSPILVEDSLKSETLSFPWLLKGQPDSQIFAFAIELTLTVNLNGHYVW